MKLRHSTVISTLLGTVAAFGQQAATDTGGPLTAGGFEHEGSITTGYRFTDVHGYRPKYQELFDRKTKGGGDGR